uniref:tissue factor pathway inhibitor-like isoform X3 n=1 Tax=Scatophagus argus TaxID=75038 RepID=UPI001ED82262|nr:tissue factor pathway inhibitor-like isoform X3 [Scatophagus argus]
MTQKVLSGVWFSLLAVACFLSWSGLTQVPEPAQCLASGIYHLIRLPDYKDPMHCWRDCFAEPDCHMAVVATPLSGSNQCLLVNCLNQGEHSFPRDLSAQIRVYPKSISDEGQRDSFRKGAYGRADERLYCFLSVKNNSCQSGTLRFFYNGTSFRCESFYSGCESNKKTFETQEACEALCNEKYRCYRPMQYGGCGSHFLKVFYNVTSQRCERFDFSGCGSNGNIFSTVEECERLCGDVKAPPASPPAVDSASTARPATMDSGTTVALPTGAKDRPVTASTVPPKNTGVLSVIVVVFLLSVVVVGCCRKSRRPSSISYKGLFRLVSGVRSASEGCPGAAES